MSSRVISIMLFLCFGALIFHMPVHAYTKPHAPDLVEYKEGLYMRHDWFKGANEIREAIRRMDSHEQGNKYEMCEALKNSITYWASFSGSCLQLPQGASKDCIFVQQYINRQMGLRAELGCPPIIPLDS